VEDIRFLTEKPPKLVKLSEGEFLEKLEEYIANLENKIQQQEEEIQETLFENLLEGSDSPVIQLLNSILLKAIRGRVSDIHFEPFSDKVSVRYRLDGVLHEVNTLPKNSYPQVVSRIKVISKLNVAEKRLPQDGRIRVKTGNREIDMRVSTLPTVFGERIVIRLLDKSAGVILLDELGFSHEDKGKYRRIVRNPHGIILITGPTGSGKSTTLYATLMELKSPAKNIITIEDPVEYQIDGISQIQVNPQINLTFASGLRSILRQDPDIIMVGEIRDFETAEIAVHASMTGHLVLSTLHTNDAPSAVARLVDMGVEPFLIAASLEGVVAQRLVRKVCENCKESRKPTEWELAQIEKHSGERPEKIFYGKGCEECMGTGFKGRIAVYEIMDVDEELRSKISKNLETYQLRNLAREKGMKTLSEDGMKKVLSGHTTVEEVLQITQV